MSDGVDAEDPGIAVSGVDAEGPGTGEAELVPGMMVAGSGSATATGALVCAAGAAAVMPLGSPIGSNRGFKTRELVEILISEIKIPVIVDAGLGSPSSACECMEIG